MATVRDGQGNGNPGRDPARRLRLDPRAKRREIGRALSGRRFVLLSAVVLALLWGGLYLVFRDWRARHRELAAYGRAHVAAAIDPLADLRPPGVDPQAWRKAIDATRRMLADVTASGLLDRPGLDALRDDVQARVSAARARPESAVEILSKLWDDMSRRTKLRTDLVPRPKLLEEPVTRTGMPRGNG